MFLERHYHRIPSMRYGTAPYLPNLKVLDIFWREMHPKFIVDIQCGRRCVRIQMSALPAISLCVDASPHRASPFGHALPSRQQQHHHLSTPQHHQSQGHLLAGALPPSHRLRPALLSDPRRLWYTSQYYTSSNIGTQRREEPKASGGPMRPQVA